MPEYRVVFTQQPLPAPHRDAAWIKAENDVDALEQAAARWPGPDVEAIHGYGENRWSQWRVWSRGMPQVRARRH